MIILKLGDITLKISEKIIDQMLQFKQDTNDKHESGGILIGYYIEELSFTLTNITTPSKLDRSSRFFFTRNKNSAQNAINKFFKESNGKKIYLGEWHSHPEDMPKPSFLDCKSIKEQIKLNKLNSKIIFMIIIGNGGFSISIVEAEKIIFQKKIGYDQILTISNVKEV